MSHTYSDVTERPYRSHDTLGDNCSWTIIVRDLGGASPESSDILSLDTYGLKAMTLESLGEIVSFEVVGRVAGDGNVTCRRSGF